MLNRIMERIQGWCVSLKQLMLCSLSIRPVPGSPPPLDQPLVGPLDQPWMFPWTHPEPTA